MLGEVVKRFCFGGHAGGCYKALYHDYMQHAMIVKKKKMVRAETRMKPYSQETGKRNKTDHHHTAPKDAEENSSDIHVFQKQNKKDCSFSADRV